MFFLVYIKLAIFIIVYITKPIRIIKKKKSILSVHEICFAPKVRHVTFLLLKCLRNYSFEIEKILSQIFFYYDYCKLCKYSSS